MHQFNSGDKVTYITSYKIEKGIVKRLSDEKHVFVVYNCGGDWVNFKDYTAARTPISNLRRGWPKRKDS